MNVKTYATHDEWLAANPLYKWRGKGQEPKSMDDVAATCGSSKMAISFWERGEYLPKRKFMLALADMMNLKVDTLYRHWETWLDAKPVPQPRSKRGVGASASVDKIAA